MYRGKMLNLKKDFFIRLAVSAQKNSEENKQFKTFQATTHLDKITPTNNTLEIPKNISTDSSNSSQNRIINISPPEKIDEKVDRILHNPLLTQVQLELEFAKELLKKIKSEDSSNPKIPAIEETISRLMSILDQKSYA